MVKVWVPSELLARVFPGRSDGKVVVFINCLRMGNQRWGGWIGSPEGQNWETSSGAGGLPGSRRSTGSLSLDLQPAFRSLQPRFSVVSPPAPLPTLHYSTFLWPDQLWGPAEPQGWPAKEKLKQRYLPLADNRPRSTCCIYAHVRVKTVTYVTWYMQHVGTHRDPHIVLHLYFLKTTQQGKHCH